MSRRLAAVRDATLRPLRLAVVLSALLFCCRVPVVAQPLLFPAQHFGAGNRQTIIGDFNGDGKPDIAAVTLYNLYVYPGKDNGTFGAPTVLPLTIPAFENIYSFVAGDMDGDGKFDIVLSSTRYDYLSHSYINDLVVLLNNGDATFRVAADYANTTFFAVSLTLADLNGDGKLDVVANMDFTPYTNPLTGATQIYLGKGDGTLTHLATYNDHNGPYSAAVGDFDGDGKPDIAVNSDKGVRIFKGNGDGTFTLGAFYAAPGNANGIVAADLNGDGKLDLVYSSGYIIVRTGNGDGTFGPPASYAHGSSVTSFAVRDFNGDGKLDVVANSDNVALGMFETFLNKGDGTLLPPVYSGPGEDIYTPYALPVADFNGDGKLDAVAILNDAGQTAQSFVILPGKGDGKFLPDTYSVNDAAASVAIGDFNGDGKPDILSLDTPVYPTAGSNVLRLLLNQGSGVYLPAPTVTLGIGSATMKIGDFNGDGKLDAAILTSGGVSVYLGNGDGTFQNLITTGISSSDFFSFGGLYVGDFNGDGKLDILTLTFSMFDHRAQLPYFSGFAILFGAGDGTFGTPRNTVVSDNDYFFISDVALGDFNGDGKLDVVAASHYSGTLVYLLGDGTGGFAFAGHNYNYGFINSVLVGDFNGDGKADILVTANGGYSVHNAPMPLPATDMLPGNGDGTFGAAVHTGLAPTSGLKTADLNGDGKLDLVDYLGNVALSNGNGTFSPVVSYYVGNGSGGFAIGDLNGDGRPDLVFPNANYNVQAGSQLVLLYNAGGVRSLSGHVTLEGLVGGAPAQTVAFEFHPDSGGPVILRTTLVGPVGAFTLTDIPAGSYVVHIKSANMLAKNIPIDLNSGDVTDISATLRAGDANNDNQIDLADFGLVVNAYGGVSNDPTSGYDPNADFNGDGTVDIADFSLLVGNYGMTGDL